MEGNHYFAALMLSREKAVKLSYLERMLRRASQEPRYHFRSEAYQVEKISGSPASWSKSNGIVLGALPINRYPKEEQTLGHPVSQFRAFSEQISFSI